MLIVGWVQKKLSRIAKKLGTDDTFAEEFKAAFQPETEYEQILERIHLEQELDAARKVITALKKYPNDPDCVRIIKEMQAQPTRRKKDCPLCPIWRHEREAHLTMAAISRYVFPRVLEQLYLVTIVFDFAENLYQLEDQLIEANRSLDQMAAFMGKRRYGVLMVGSFEFDLCSHVELTKQHKHKALLAELGTEAPPSGGWVLTGHFFTRVPHRDVLEPWLRERYPSSDKAWRRVRFDAIKSDKDLTESVMRTLSYADKVPTALFKVPTRKTKDGKRDKANELMQRMAGAFYGSSFGAHIDPATFDLNAAIVQWAKFVDRMGSKNVYYSVESAHAQKWLSESEMDYLRMTDEDLYGDGLHKYEIHRDQEFYPPFSVKDHLKGRKRNLRSRPLSYDAEWVSMTSCDGINPDTHYHDFDSWTVKP
ncbi:MAG: hypothetical protein AAFM92_10865 [Pseudomonadota bacterium]